MRICIVYDCLFPHTVGGAERWYRELATRLAADGHEVTYLTLRQWPRGGRPDLPGVDVIAVGPRLALYTASGRRRVAPPLVFGAGVLWHLLRRGRRYDVVHTASFPYFPLLAAAAARPVHGCAVVVDWHELWTRVYWREYLGPLGGRAGWAVQRACLRVRQRAYCFAQLTARRLREEHVNGEVTVLSGQHVGPGGAPRAGPAAPLVVFVGRLVPEKRPAAAVAAIALARRRLPGLRGVIFGDGPERAAVRSAIGEHGLEGVVETPGFADRGEVERALSEALCLLHPSVREGYGAAVVEAAAAGVPVVLAAGPDNAATELVEPGVNGFVAPDASAEALAAEIVRVSEAGPALRRSTADWFARNAGRLSIEASVATVAAGYADGPAGG